MELGFNSRLFGSHAPLLILILTKEFKAYLRLTSRRDEFGLKLSWWAAWKK